MSRTRDHRTSRGRASHAEASDVTAWGFDRESWQQEEDWFDWSPVTDRFATQDENEDSQEATSHFRWGGRRSSRGRALSSVQLLIIHAVGSRNNAGQTAYNTFMAAATATARHEDSAHFIVDRSGLVFQVVKEKHIALHSSDGVDDESVGVEHSNATGSRLSEGGFDSEAFEWPLLRASLRLARWVLRRHRIEANYPGDPFRRLPDRERLTTFAGFHGVVGHRHIHTGGDKPCPTLNFPWRHYLMELQGNAYAPVSSSTDPSPLSDSDVAYCRGREARASGVFHGFRHDIHLELHSGTHLADVAAGTPVRCPFYGKIVAARSYRPAGAPDTWRESDAVADWDKSFVLIRHEVTVGDDTLVFFSLLANLMDIAPRAHPFTPPGGSQVTSTNSGIPWFDELYHLERAGDRTTNATLPWLNSETNDVVTFSLEDAIAVFPGEVIGHTGVLPWAPGRARRAGLHFEVFADPAVIAPLVATAHLLEAFALVPAFDGSADANASVPTGRSPGLSYLHQILDAGAVWQGAPAAITAGRSALLPLRDPPASIETWTPPSDLEHLIFQMPSQWSSAYPANPSYTGADADHRDAEQWLDSVAAVGFTQVASLHPVAFFQELMTRYQRHFDEQNPDILRLPAPGSTHSLSREEMNELLGDNDA